MEQVQKIFEFIGNNSFLSAIIGIVITLFVAYIIWKIISAIFNRIELKNKAAVTYLVFLRKIIKGAIIIFAVFGVIMQIKPMQQFAISLLAGSGIAVVAFSFAAQEALANVVSGIFISMFKPFAIGDRIKIEDQNLMGFVEDITLRHTVIKTIENNRLIVPNSTMNKAVLQNYNFTENNTCTYLDIGIGYDSDVDKAIEIINEEVLKHKSYIDIRSEEEKQAGAIPVATRIVNFGPSALELRTLLWTKDFGTGYVTACDLRYTIKKRFDKEGIEIPYQYHNIIVKTHENSQNQMEQKV